MGLFTRKAESKAEIETMKSELASMRERLDATDAIKARLAEQLGSVEAENQRLVGEVDAVGSKVSSVETKVGSVETKVDSVERSAARSDAVAKIELDVAKIGDLTSRIDELGASFDAQLTAGPDDVPPPSGPALESLVAQLTDLSDALSHQQRQIADVALVATDAAERTTNAETTVGELAKLDRSPRRDSDVELRQQIGQLAGRVASIDARMNQVSLELTNQLSELSGDIDRAAATPAAAPAPTDNDAIIAEIERLMAERIDPTIVDVTDGQERLAVEQARYAIAFRQDLAELADRLRKPSERSS